MFSRFDLDHPLSTCAKPIVLEAREWRSCEHYVHAKLAGNKRLVARTEEAETGLEAFRINKPWYRTKCKGWKNLRRVYMTRALYTLVQMYPEIKDYLLDTGEQKIAETTMYDHYWGIGRDQRGENMVGLVWMDIRQKLQEVDTEHADEGDGE